MRRLVFSLLTSAVFVLLFVACTIMNDRHLPASRDGSTASRDDGDISDPTGDGSTPGDAGPVPPGTICNTTAPFTTFRDSKVAALNTVLDEELPRLSADELSIYYFRDDFDAGSTLFVATRPSIDASFGGSTPALPGVPSVRGAATTSDGLRLYFAQASATDDTVSLRFADRKSTAEPFGNVRPLIEAAPVEIFLMPVVHDEPGGQRLYFSRYNDDLGHTDLLSVLLDPTGSIVGQPSGVAGINTTAGEFDPTPSADGLTLYFYSDRDDTDRGRIFVARRASIADNFGQVSRVAEIPKPPDGWVGPGYLSRDNCRLYYYHADQADGPADLSIAERLP